MHHGSFTMKLENKVINAGFNPYFIIKQLLISTSGVGQTPFKRLYNR
jgi:hypothetical protein